MLSVTQSLLYSAFIGGQRLLWGPKPVTSKPQVSFIAASGRKSRRMRMKSRRERLKTRHFRIRKKVEGTPERPRLCIFRSLKNIYAQVIDDSKSHTLASASTLQEPICDEFHYTSGPTIEVAKRVGEVIAKSCLEKGITTVVYDRGGFPYMGQVAALADSARKHGLIF